MMNSTRLIVDSCLIFVLSVAGIAPEAHSDLYVSTDGKDSNPGTIERPLRTIQHAADMAKPGVTVYVRGGSYCQQLAIKVSGNAQQECITFQSEPGEHAVLDGGCLTAPEGDTGMVELTNVNFVRVRRLEVRNYRTHDYRSVPWGIRVSGGGSHIEILGNDVHHIEQNSAGGSGPGLGANGIGIGVYGTDAKIPIADLVIDGNEVHHLKTGLSESLVVNGNVAGFRVTKNSVHDNNNIGIDVIGFERTAPDPAVDQARDGVVSNNLVYNITSRGNPAYRNDESSDGIYVDGGTRVLIEQNVMHDVDFGIELASEHQNRATSYVIARNNLIYHCHTAGVSIGGYAPERGRTEHCTVVNNTLHDNDTSGTGSGEFQMQWKMANNIFENNIVYARQSCLVTLNKSQV